MPTRTFTNKDLNKSLPKSALSKTYTNADLDIQDDFEPDDFEASTDDFIEDDFIPDNEQVQTSQKEPSLWEQINTPLIDAPSRAARALNLDEPRLDANYLNPDSALGKMETFGRRANAMIRGGIQGSFEGLGDLMSQSTSPLSLATMAAGPLIKPATRLLGYPTELAGKVIKNYGMTPMPRFLESRLQRGIERGIGSGVEKLGQGMKNVGKKAITPDSNIIKAGDDLSSYKPTSDVQPFKSYKPVGQINLRPAVITNEDLAETGNAALSKSGYRAGQHLDHNNALPLKREVITSDDLANVEDAFNTSGYKPGVSLKGNEALPLKRDLITGEDLASYMQEYKPKPRKNRPGAVERRMEKNEPVPMEKAIITNEDYANLGDKAANSSGYRTGQNLEQLENFPLTEGESIFDIKYGEPTRHKVIAQDKPPKLKPKLRTNGDGTYMNVDTGEVVDKMGQPIIELNGKPITKDSDFFTRNRR